MLLESILTVALQLPTSKTYVPYRRAFVESERACLIEALWFEARGEQPLGQAYVAQVIINRAKSSRFANTVCAVIKQAHQFEYQFDGKPEHIVLKDRKALNALENLTRIADAALDGQFSSLTSATHFFNHNLVVPAWAVDVPVSDVTIIGNHTFLSVH